MNSLQRAVDNPFCIGPVECGNTVFKEMVNEVGCCREQVEGTSSC